MSEWGKGGIAGGGGAGGPPVSVDNAIVLWDGVDGSLLKDSAKTIGGASGVATLDVSAILVEPANKLRTTLGPTTLTIADIVDGEFVKRVGTTLVSASTTQTITLTGDVTGSGTGSFSATITADSVTYAKIQNVSAADKLLGRGNGGGAGDIQEITLGSGLSMTGTTLNATGSTATIEGTVGVVDNRVPRSDGTGGVTLQGSLLTVDDSGNTSTSGTLGGSNLSGTNTGDQTITLTGDVTGSGTGSFAATIANDSVTFAKMQDISAASRVVGRGSAGGAGDAEELTLGSNLSIAGTVLSAVGLSGTNTGDQTITLTGDVTGSGTGSFATTIAADTVTYAKIQNVSAGSKVLGRGDGGAGDIQELILGTNLSITGTTLNASGGTATVDGTVGVVDNRVPRSDGTGGVTLQGSLLTVDDSGNTSTSGTISGSNLSGTNTGDQTITLTGDITGSGTGSFAATIANDSVTFAKVQNVAADRLTGRGNGGGSGDMQEIVLGTGLSMTGTTLNVAASTATIEGTVGVVDNRVARSDGTGGVTLQGSLLTVDDSGNTSTSGTISGSNLSGTNTGDQTITLTGDITGSGTGSFAATIANDSVTFAKMQDVIAEKLLGRGVGATGDTQEITLGTGLSMTGTTLNAAVNSATIGGTVGVVDNRVPRSDGTGGVTLQGSLLTVDDSGNTSTAGTLGGSNLSGTNTGDQTITLTGDVTGSGTGSFAATIANAAITYAKIQDVSAASRVIGRGSAGGAGDVEELTLGSNLSIAGTVLSAVGLSGTNTGDQTITLTGDVTGSGTGSFAATIANDSVTFAKMQDIATDRLLGRSTAATGNIEELTVGTGLSLSAGVLSVTGGVPGGSTTQLQFNNAGAFGGMADYTYATTTGLVVAKAAPTAIPSAGYSLYADPWGRIAATSATDFSFSPTRRSRTLTTNALGGGGLTLSNDGVTAPTAHGTATLSDYAVTNARTGTRCLSYAPTTTANSACSGWSWPSTSVRLPLYTDPAHGGLRSKFTAMFSIAGITASNARFFAGLSETPTSFSANPNAAGSGLGTRMGLGFGDDQSAEFHFITTLDGAANSVVATGITATAGHVYYVEMFAVPNSANVVGYLWRQTTFGGSWTLEFSYSYATTGNLLAETQMSMGLLGGNGAAAAAALEVYTSFMTAEIR